MALPGYCEDEAYLILEITSENSPSRILLVLPHNCGKGGKYGSKFN